MKSLKDIINEKLILSKHVKKYNYFPKNPHELCYKILKEKLEKTKGNLLDLTDIDVSEIDNLSGLFYDINEKYPNIEIIDITGWDTSKVTDISEMFSWCINIKQIIGLEYLNVENCKYMDNVFVNCCEIESIDLSNWEPVSLINCAYMFNGCPKLVEIKGIEKWDEYIANISIDNLEQMFNGCPKLKLDLRNWYDYKDTSTMVAKCPKIIL